MIEGAIPKEASNAKQIKKRTDGILPPFSKRPARLIHIAGTIHLLRYRLMRDSWHSGVSTSNLAGSKTESNSSPTLLLQRMPC